MKPRARSKSKMCFALCVDLCSTKCFSEGFCDKLDGHCSSSVCKAGGHPRVVRWQLKHSSRPCPFLLTAACCHMQCLMVSRPRSASRGKIHVWRNDG